VSLPLDLDRDENIIKLDSLSNVTLCPCKNSSRPKLLIGRY
jgi:hypothetical protein